MEKSFDETLLDLKKKFTIVDCFFIQLDELFLFYKWGDDTQLYSLDFLEDFIDVIDACWINGPCIESGG
jgi:hypothetical protein